MNTLKRNLASYENSSRCNEMDGSEQVDVLIFDLSTIISSTDDFSNGNKLGEGGFGSVYKVPLDMLLTSCPFVEPILLENKLHFEFRVS